MPHGLGGEPPMDGQAAPKGNGRPHLCTGLPGYEHAEHAEAQQNGTTYLQDRLKIISRDTWPEAEHTYRSSVYSQCICV